MTNDTRGLVLLPAMTVDRSDAWTIFAIQKSFPRLWFTIWTLSWILTTFSLTALALLLYMSQVLPVDTRLLILLVATTVIPYSLIKFIVWKNEISR